MIASSLLSSFLVAGSAGADALEAFGCLPAA
jgi:hypothetical protein